MAPHNKKLKVHAEEAVAVRSQKMSGGPQDGAAAGEEKQISHGLKRFKIAVNVIKAMKRWQSG